MRDFRQRPADRSRCCDCLIATATPRELSPIARARRAYAPDATAPAEWDFRWSSAASVSWTQNEALASVEEQHCRPRPLFVVAERFGGGRGDTLARRA
jgi:hypothetical protein